MWQEGSRAHTDLNTLEEDTYCRSSVQLQRQSSSVTIRIYQWSWFHFSGDCAAEINNSNGSWLLFHSHKLLLSLTGLSLRFVQLHQKHQPASVCVFVLYVVWLRPLLELMDSLNCLWSVSGTRCWLSHSWCWWSTTARHILSAVNKKEQLCTDNTEPHRKACRIIFIMSSSSVSTSSESFLVPQSGTESSLSSSSSLYHLETKIVICT